MTLSSQIHRLLFYLINFLIKVENISQQKCSSIFTTHTLLPIMLVSPTDSLLPVATTEPIMALGVA